MEHRRVENEVSGCAEAVSPGARLAQLISRAHSAPTSDDSVPRRLTEALMHHCELLSSCQRRVRPSLHCSAYQHAFLLSDGSCLTLWELRHRTVEDGPLSHEVHFNRGSLLHAEARVFEKLGIARHHAMDGSWGDPVPLRGEGPLTVPCAYPERDSPEHARRLLRRAENADRPGTDVLHRLQRSHDHHIARLAKPCGAHRHQRVWCSLYEHSFLLDGGDEISLYELEHNLTPDGRLVCEVYLDEETADQAADRYARARGVEL